MTKKLIYAIFFIVPFFWMQAHTTDFEAKTFYLAKIRFDEEYSFYEAIADGLDMESLRKRGDAYEIILAESEFEYLNDKGVDVEILSFDIAAETNSRIKANSDKKPETMGDGNFEFGSMGGYFTLEEIYENFDLMREKFPEYCGVSEIIGESIQSRPIRAYSFGTPGKPQILFTTLHHAREPGSASAVIYYLQSLLQRAAAGDEQAAYLLENRDVRVIACINPDGYYYNQTKFPEGGGMWRKNMRSKNGKLVGVDINRNYGPLDFWDAPNGGSSTDSSKSTYRGDAPFSEPETQAVRDYCSENDFIIALNFHSYGELIIYPWSALESECEDSLFFRAFGANASDGNGFIFGTDMTTLNYQGRGVSDDWMYLSDENRDKIYAMTVEVGDDESFFWAENESDILRHCEAVYPALEQALWSAEANVEVFNARSGWDFELQKPYIEIEFANAGVDSLENAAHISINPLNDGIEIISPQRNIGDLASGEKIWEKFYLKCDDTLQNGFYSDFEIEVSQYGVSRKDTTPLEVYKPKYEDLFVANEDFAKWRAPGESAWGAVEIGGSAALSDSPDSLYADEADNYLYFNDEIDLTEALLASLEFEAQWSVEKGYDVALIEASSDGGETWSDLRSSRMKIGLDIVKARQKPGVYGFGGYSPDWTYQSCPLDGFLGEKISLRLSLLSDGHLTFDGIIFRNMRLKTFFELPSAVADKNMRDNIRAVWNSDTERLTLSIGSVETARKYETIICDAFGRIAARRFVAFENSTAEIELKYAVPGAYFAIIKAGAETFSAKFLIY